MGKGEDSVASIDPRGHQVHTVCPSASYVISSSVSSSVKWGNITFPACGEVRRTVSGT